MFWVWTFITLSKSLLFSLAIQRADNHLRIKTFIQVLVLVFIWRAFVVCSYEILAGLRESLAIVTGEFFMSSTCLKNSQRTVGLTLKINWFTRRSLALQTSSNVLSSSTFLSQTNIMLVIWYPSHKKPPQFYPWKITFNFVAVLLTGDTFTATQWKMACLHMSFWKAIKKKNKQLHTGISHPEVHFSTDSGAPPTLVS